MHFSLNTEKPRKKQHVKEFKSVINISKKIDIRPSTVLILMVMR